MTEAGSKYISDIIYAIELIDKFTQDTPDYATYERDSKTQSATERQLAIIGEALNKLQKIEPDLSIKNHQQIISFRNRLVHAYDSIDNAIVWTILKKHLPALRKELTNK